MVYFFLVDLLLVGLAAAVASLAITPIVRFAARRFGVVEQSAHRPDAGPIPTLGGLAVLVALLGSIAVGLAVKPGLGYLLGSSLLEWRWSIGGAILIAGLGLIDDVYKLRPWSKIVFQVAAACMVVADGHGIGGIINPFTGETLFLGWLAAPITLLWMIGITNAFNLIDGLDGLAAGVGLIASLTLTLIALAGGRLDVALIAAALAGALAGFLYYNFSPASIFLGDSGSMLVGYILAALYVRGAQQGGRVPLLAPILALALPIADTLLAIVRRGMRPAGDPDRFFARLLAIFRRDQEHIHHRLIAAGLKESRAVLVLYGAAAASGFAAVLTFNSAPARLAAVAAVGGALYFGLRKLG